MSAALSGVSEVRRAVEVRPEADALFVDRAPLAERERLVAAAVGQDRAVPRR